jgi:predicted GNAT family acetyltransferase
VQGLVLLDRGGRHVLHLEARLVLVGLRAQHAQGDLGSSLVSWSLARRFGTGTQSALLMLSPANRTAVRAYEKVGFRRHRLVDVLARAI